MKRKVFALLSALLILSGFTACKDKDVKDDNISIINFTDTGEDSSAVGGRRTDIEHLSSDKDSVVTSQQSSDTVSEKGNEASESKKQDSDTPGKKTVSTTPSSDTSSKASDSSSNNAGQTNRESVQSETNSNNNTSRLQNHDSQDTDTADSTDTESDTDTEALTSHPNNDESAQTGEFTKDDIAFLINGSKIRLGEDLESVIVILGEPDSIDVEEVSHISKTYNYPGFWVKFIQAQDSDIFTVDAIQIYSDDFETEKGAKVFMPLDEAKRIYGECSTVIDNEYRYYFENRYMYFYAPNGTVANIGYNIDYNVDNENS